MSITYNNAAIVRSGLVLHLDAANVKSYPGTGTTWYDISGNGNHFTIYNGVSFTNGRAIFDGVNDYVRSSSQINLSGTTSITVELICKVPAVTTNVMYFEHTADWNVNGGAFGAYSNSNGGTASSPTTDNDIHTNSATGRNDFAASDLTTFSHLAFIFQSAAATKSYQNSNLLSGFNTSIGSTSGYANDYLHIGTRGGTSGFGQMTLGGLRLYNRALSATEIAQNFAALRGRYGI